jgi:hypothetical protein
MIRGKMAEPSQPSRVNIYQFIGHTFATISLQAATGCIFVQAAEPHFQDTSKDAFPHQVFFAPNPLARIMVVPI